MKFSVKDIILFIIIPLAVGALSALLATRGMMEFASVAKPPLSPPGWLFPVVWTVLFVLMGIASYIVYVQDVPQEQKNTALLLYGIQLAVNFLWSIIFFNLHAYLFAFLWLILLWILIIATTIAFRRISKTAGFIMLPYILWVTFAGYLNLGIYLLNR